MSNETDTLKDTRGKEIVLRLGQLGVEVTAHALQLGLASSFINCAVDVWRIKARPKQEQLAAALLARNLDLVDRLEAAATDGTNGLRADELELIGVGMSALSPTANAERIERIAKLISSGLDATEVETSRAKRLAKLLGQLDDEHLLVLMFHDRTADPASQGRMAAQHPELFPSPDPKSSMRERLERAGAGLPPLPEPPKPTDAETREKVSRRLHFKLCAEHLLSFGLLAHEQTENGIDTRVYRITGPGHEFLNAVGLLSMARPDRKPFAFW